ncbi:MAG: hypothetical protein IPF79_02610 [Ignavibacteria bacterium]|nr:hypothetical protein [Ignavibacteria bacterium]
MKKFKLTLTDFPKAKALNGDVDIRFSQKALIRGAIAAGQSPRKRVTARDELAHLDELAALIRSSLDTSGPELYPTTLYKGLGSTAKGIKSFGIGNALCAHTAYVKLGIPWLIDIEKLPARVSVQFKRNSNQRGDFIGKDTKGNWYAFESKGRGRKPSCDDLEKWKKQVKTVKAINGKAPACHIVSAAYLNSNKVWEVIWVDPPAERGVTINLSERHFFDEYYSRLFLALVKQSGTTTEGFQYGPSTFLPRSKVEVGLHSEVFSALQTGNYARIAEFGQRNLESSEDLKSEDTTLFADGIFVRIRK